MIDDPNYYKIILNSQVLPAPHEHILAAAIQIGSNSVHVDINLKYTNRENLSQIEIEEEGFSGDDDEAYVADLDASWQVYLQHVYLNSTPDAKRISEESTRIEVSNKAGQMEAFNGNKEWTYLLQTLYQGVLESKNLEAPLTIKLYELLDQNKDEFTLTFYFSKLEIHIVHNEHAVIIPAVGWEKGQQLLQAIFSAEYIPEKAITRLKPGSTGSFIDPGERQWYHTQLGVRWERKGHNVTSIKELIYSLVSTFS